MESLDLWKILLSLIQDQQSQPHLWTPIWLLILKWERTQLQCKLILDPAISYSKARWEIRSKHDLTPAISRTYLDSPIWQTNTKSPTALIRKMHSLCKPTMELSNPEVPLKVYMFTNNQPVIWSTWLRRNLCLHQWKLVGGKLSNMVSTVTDNRKGYTQRQF